MNVITLRDYARQNNISYEAVRKQLVRYKDELGDHIIRDGRQQFLDEEAVAFLDGKRQKNPVAIIHQDKDERIEALQNELNMAKDMIIGLQEERNKLKEEKYALEAENAKIALLEADNEAARAKAAEAEQEAAEAERLIEVLREDLEAEQRRADSARAYAAELEAWTKLPWLKRIRTPKPVQPADRLDN